MAAGGGSRGKKPAAKKTTPVRKATARKSPATAAKKRSGARATKKAPSGKRLPSGQMYLRDALIVQRHVQGWPWEAIAAEAGISVRAAQEAAERRRAQAPLALKADPLKVVEDIMLGFQTSIGDFEALAVRYQDAHPAAAVGAKRAANEARNSVLVLLQATGRLPEDLVTLRHLIEQRQMAVTMLDTMERFQARISALPAGVPEDIRSDLERAVGDVVHVFEDLIGLREEVAPLVDRALPAPSDD